MFKRFIKLIKDIHTHQNYYLDNVAYSYSTQENSNSALYLVTSDYLVCGVRFPVSI